MTRYIEACRPAFCADHPTVIGFNTPRSVNYNMMIRRVDVKNVAKRADLIPGLNTLRFLLALWVVLIHYHFFMKWTNTDVVPNQLPFYNYIGYLYNNGTYPVPLFWAISGAVFAVAYPRTESFHMRQFVVARFSRLFPLHWLLLMLCIAISLLKYAVFGENTSLSVPKVLVNLLLLQRWQPLETESINGPSWSISVELITYTIFALYRRFESKITTALIICTSAIMLKFDSDFSLSPFKCICLFFTTRLLIVHMQTLSAKQRVASLGILVTTAICSLILFPVFSVLVVAPVTVVMVISIYSWLPRLPDPQSIGDVTYALYLLHMPIMHVLVITIKLLHLNTNLFLYPFFFITYVMGLLLLSHLTFVRFEQPARQLIRRWFNRNQPR